MEISVYQTNRLLLRKLTPEVYSYYFTNFNEAQIRESLRLNSEVEYKKQWNRHQLGFSAFNSSFVFFQLIEKLSDSVIGGCGLHNWHREHFRAEIGYALDDDVFKQKGYITEAVAFAIDYGFIEMNLHRIEAFVAKDNIPSLRVMQKFGFRQEGCKREHYLYHEKFEDSLVFSLLQSEYSV